MFRSFLLLLIVVGSNVVYAQGTSTWSYGLNPYYGAVLKYKEQMKQLEFTDLYGVELYANKVADGSKAWHHLYNYPQWGVAASYFNYGVPNELGWVTSLTTYLDFTAGKKKHKWRINIGTGAVYSSKTFEPVTNEENTAISSKISYVLRGTIHKEFQLNEQYYFNVNLAFRHYSNGRLNMPNNGMNYPIIGVGLRYLPNPVVRKSVEGNSVIKEPKVRLSLRGSMAWREVWEIDEKQRAYSLGVYAAKQVSKFNSVLLGVDAFRYDQESIEKSNIVYRDKEGLDESEALDDSTDQVAITIGTELLISKVSVIVQAGIYVHKPQVFYANWYQRYGLKYNFSNHVFGQFSLKSHSRTADMIEFGAGFTILYSAISK